MRYRLAMLTAASLLFARPGLAQAPLSQTPVPPVGSAATAVSPFHGTFDVGGLVTTTDGDEARFERYRDARDGVYSGFALKRDSASYLFDASVSHVGYRDQRYDARLIGPRVKFGFDWTSLPLNYSYLTRTPYATNGSTLTLDDAAQRAVEAKTAVGVPCSAGAPPAACSNPTQAAEALANRSIYTGLATPFGLRHRRDVAGVDLTYSATRALDVDAKFTSTKREGQQPYGASFAFSNAIELPLPINQRTNDLTLGTTWANDRSMFRVAWDGSWFNNAFQSLVWDNPVRFTNFSNGLLPPVGPYDPAGYSNGNGPAQGRLATAPDNTMQVVSATALHRLAGKTTVNGTIQLTSQNQNEALIPWTINSVINSPTVFAAFPHLAQLPRPTAEAEAKGLNTLINMSSRAFRYLNITARYRYNRRDVQTPVFDATEYVRFDAVPEENEEGFSPQFDNSRHLLDANVAFTPARAGTIRVGYGLELIARRGRGFANVNEHIVRASYDVYSNQYVTMRASTDVGRRRGEGFVEAASGNDEAELVVGPGGTQPTLRYYDEADRDRTRGSLVFIVMPRDTVDISVQIAGGKDRYLVDPSAPVSRPGELFGLQEQTNRSWNIGINFHPTDVVSASANYGRDAFGSQQKSRNANPPPDPSWTDPSRDWTLDNDDTINSFTASLDLLRAIRRTDIRVGYDYSDSDNSFVHGGPRITALAALGLFIPLPNVTNTWQRATVDVQYFFTSRVGVGVGYYFDKLDVVDFNTIDTNGSVGVVPATGIPRIDYLGELNTGYGNRPYRGGTGFVRLLYTF